MGPSFEGYDIQVGLQPFCLGRRAHSGGIPADDNKSFPRHISFTSIQDKDPVSAQGETFEKWLHRGSKSFSL
jgi:hypothetical protein